MSIKDLEILGRVIQTGFDESLFNTTESTEK